jgi:hypothetical protein
VKVVFVPEAVIRSLESSWHGRVESTFVLRQFANAGTV